MEIHIPEEIKHYEPELRLVFDLMVRKLNINRHKGWGDADLNHLKSNLENELNEMFKAMEEEGQFELAMEAVDVANMAVLLALWALGMDKKRYKEVQRAGKILKEGHDNDADNS